MAFIKRARWELALIALITGLTLLLWAEVGFSVGFWADGWLHQAGIDLGRVWSLVPARPFVILAHYLGMLITPDSTVGLNIAFFVALVLRSVAFYAVVAALSRSRVWAAACALLLVFFPADTALFNSAIVTQISGSALYLLALAAFLWSREGGRWRLLMIPGWAALLGTLGMYDAVYPLFFCTPLLFWWQERHLSRRVILISLLWWSALLPIGIRLLFLLQTNPGLFAYQQQLSEAGVTVGGILNSTQFYLQRLFFGGWVGPFASTLTDAMLGTLAAAASLGLLWFWVQKYPLPTQRRHSLELMLIGLAGTFLGFAMFLPTSLSGSTDRTLMYSLPGASLALVSGLVLLDGAARRWRLRPGMVFAVGTTVLLALGATQLLAQHRYYALKGETDRAFLRAMLTAAPGMAGDAALLVLDASATAEGLREMVPLSIYIDGMWDVINPANDTAAAYCLTHPDQAVWGTLGEHCEFTETGVLVTDAAGWTWFDAPYERLVVIEVAPDGTMHRLDSLSAFTDAPAAMRYNPLSHLNEDAPLPPRAIGMLQMGAAEISLDR